MYTISQTSQDEVENKLHQSDKELEFAKAIVHHFEGKPVDFCLNCLAKLSGLIKQNSLYRTHLT